MGSFGRKFKFLLTNAKKCRRILKVQSESIRLTLEKQYDPKQTITDRKDINPR